MTRQQSNAILLIGGWEKKDLASKNRNKQTIKVFKQQRTASSFTARIAMGLER